MLFIKESVIPASPDAVWRFHETPEAFAMLVPPDEPTQVLQLPDGLVPGSMVRTRTRIFPLIWISIEAEIVAAEPGTYFEDIMHRGPFASWRHRHEMLPGPTPGTCLYRDTIHYAPPLGILGRIVDPILIRPRLTHVFNFRHEVVRRQFATHLS